jgi:hypothetical protein
MSTNIVHQHGTNHIKLTAVAAHLAGDLVCEQGFFGTVQDVVAAPATAQATTLPIAAIGAATGGAFAPATGGWIPFGKVIATGTATTAKIQHFNPNPFQVTMP